MGFSWPARDRFPIAPWGTRTLLSSRAWVLPGTFFEKGNRSSGADWGFMFRAIPAMQLTKLWNLHPTPSFRVNASSLPSYARLRVLTRLVDWGFIEWK